MLYWGRQDTQYNDIQHKGLYDTQQDQHSAIMLSVIMMNVDRFSVVAPCCHKTLCF
jgi:hypothetical protein